MVKRKTPVAHESPRVTVLEAITAPLGFFVLALLIVETFLATVLVGASLQPDQKMIGMWAGIGLFIFVTFTVSILVWYKPTHLTFDKHGHLLDRGKIPYGTEQEQVSPDKIFSATPQQESPQ